MAKFIINTGRESGSGQGIEDGQLIRQYLLGELSEEAQAKVQDRLLCDRDFFNRLVVEENELVDDYLRDALSEEQEEKFKRRFLAAPERQQKLKISKALKKWISEAPPPKPGIEERPRRKALLDLKRFSLARFAAWAIAASIFVVGVWATVENVRLRRRIDNERAAQSESFKRAQQSESRLSDSERRLSDAEQRNRELAQEIERERSLSSEHEGEVEKLKPTREAGPAAITQEAGRAAITGRLVSFALMPGLSREGGKLNQLELLQGTSRVRLELYPEKIAHKNYRAELRTREGRWVWSKDGLTLRKTAAGDHVIVTLPAAILTKGDYVLMMRGVGAKENQERAGTYYFRVVKK